MKKIYLVCFLVCFLIVPRKSSAQYNFQQLDNSTGLSNSCINSIYCDQDNLVWFGTWDGLNFFDGNAVHVFNYEKSGPDKNSIACNVIYQVAEDWSRNIWVGTVEGLSRYNKNSGAFTNYFYNAKKAISNGYTVAISETGSVYAARRNSSELFLYDQQHDTFTKTSIQGLHHFMLVQIFFDDEGNLWLLKDKGTLEAFRLEGDRFVKLENYVPVTNVDNVFYCNHQVFYQSKTHDLFRITTGYRPEKVMALSHEIRSMNIFKAHYLLAWSSKGIGEFDSSFKPSPDLATDVPVLQNVRITSVVTDHKDLLWLGTDGNGVIKVTRKENPFGLVKRQANGQAFHIPVRAFCEVDGQLWIGTKGNGIITLQNWDKKNVTFSHITSFHTNIDLLDNCVYSIEKGKDGLIYIGSDAPGITIYNSLNKRFVKWADIHGSNKYPQFGSVHCVLFDKDGSVWLGLNESGLIHLKLDPGKNGELNIAFLHQYKYQDGNSGPANNVIYSLAQGSGDNIWIGCRYGGLSVFNKKSGVFRTLKAFSYAGSLSNNDVLSLYIDRSQRLWIGTSFGLNWVDERSAVKKASPFFNKLFVDDGLPNNTIHAISEDNSGNTWISTNKGLAKINTDKAKIVQYKEADGLQSNEFSDNAVWKNESGTLFFGGIYGFNYFLPESIHLNNEQPGLLLTDLHFAGKNNAEPGLFVLSKEGTAANWHFDLRPNNDYFELTVRPISFLHSQKCQFSYFLEGNDNTWHYMGHDDRITYNNLSPGNYTLKIKWSNGEGAWTQGVAAFTLTVNQVFWLKPFAFAIYISVLLVLCYSYFRYRKNKFLIRQELKMEHMLREKDENIHQEQLNFFTNIAHELQTPLTLILGSLERYLFKNRDLTAAAANSGHFLSIVKQETSRLHYLVQQLLEFRKAESGHLQNHYSDVNISKLLDDISGLFAALVEEKNLDFSWEIEPGIVISCDRDKLEKIVFNLLSNAFKHSGDGQYVIFSVHALRKQQQLEIVVANSGCDLPEAEVNRLFDRFFVADGRDSKKSSTGIGLAFTQQMVHLLNGAIAVNCENNWISFKVHLPLLVCQEKPVKGSDEIERQEKPSYLLSAMTSGQDRINLSPIADNNKRSLVKSFEQEHKKSILIVEDDQLIRYLLKDILGETYIIYEAGTGLEALDVIKRSMPDLILSDIMMPDMNGLELCNLVKNTYETCHIPFVLLSARTAIEHKTEGYNCGADAYIPKPFQTEHLLVRIQKLIEYRVKLQQVFLGNANPLAFVTSNALEEQDKSFIEKITRLIEENLEEDIDSAFLENALNMGRMQLYRKIKTFSDMTPTELIRHIRLKKASFLLKNSDLTVSEIFYQTGFNNKTYFFREFKKIYNCSPNEYRAQHRLVVKRNN